MLPGKTLSVTDVVGMVRRRSPLLLVPPLVCLFLSLVYSSTLPDIYQSSVLIAIVPQRVPDDFVRSTVTLKTEDRLEALTTQVTSRTVLESLILEMDLYQSERARLPMEDVVVAMRTDIEVALEAQRRGPRGLEPPHAFNVRFKYPDAVMATKVTNRIASMFVDQNARDRGVLAEATNQFLEGQLAEARTRLEAQERRLEAFRERHGNELPTQVQSNMQFIQSTQLQIQALVEATARDRDRRLMLERLYSEAEKEPVILPAALPQNQTQENSTPGTATQQLEVARQTLARLELRLTPQHPDVVRARRAVAELEPKAAAEAEAAKGDGGAPVLAASPLEMQRRESLRQMRAEIESLARQTSFKESEEQRLRTVVSEYQRRLEAVPGVESEWAVLTRDYDTQQTSYRDLLNKSEAAKVAADLENRQIGEQFRVLDPAKIPERPVSPLRYQINAIGFAIGLLLGLTIAAFLEFRDTAFRTEADVLDVLRLPVLAVVPQVLTNGERMRQRRRRVLASAVVGGGVVAAGYAFWAMRLWTHLI